MNPNPPPPQAGTCCTSSKAPSLCTLMQQYIQALYAQSCHAELLRASYAHVPAALSSQGRPCPHSNPIHAGHPQHTKTCGPHAARCRVNSTPTHAHTSPQRTGAHTTSIQRSSSACSLRKLCCRGLAANAATKAAPGELGCKLTWHTAAMQSTACCGGKALRQDKAVTHTSHQQQRTHTSTHQHRHHSIPHKPQPTPPT